MKFLQFLEKLRTGKIAGEDMVINKTAANTLFCIVFVKRAVMLILNFALVAIRLCQCGHNFSGGKCINTKQYKA